jgi:hypothetical protein
MTTTTPQPSAIEAMEQWREQRSHKRTREEILRSIHTRARQDLQTAITLRNISARKYGAELGTGPYNLRGNLKPTSYDSILLRDPGVEMFDDEIIPLRDRVDYIQHTLGYRFKDLMELPDDSIKRRADCRRYETEEGLSIFNPDPVLDVDPVYQTLKGLSITFEWNGPQTDYSRSVDTLRSLMENREMDEGTYTALAEGTHPLLEGRDIEKLRKKYAERRKEQYDALVQHRKN